MTNSQPQVPRYTVCVTKFGIKDNVRERITHNSVSFVEITDYCTAMNVAYDKQKGRAIR